MILLFRTHFLRVSALALAGSVCFCSCERTAPDTHNYIAQGVKYTRNGQYRSALVKFSAALQHDPSCDLAYLYMASLFEDYLNDPSNAVTTLQAYRNNAASDFSLRIASRLLYAMEIETIEQSRRRFQEIIKTHRLSSGISNTPDTAALNVELVLARERIAMLEQQVASPLIVTAAPVPFAFAHSVITASFAAAAVTIQVARAGSNDDGTDALQRLQNSENLLRRQTALVLMLEQRYLELQQSYTHEIELRTQLETAMHRIAHTSAPPRVTYNEPFSPISSGDITHIIQSGDTLASLAQRYYGDREQWMRIYIRNRSTMLTPDTLRKGQVIIIPR